MKPRIGKLTLLVLICFIFLFTVTPLVQAQQAGLVQCGNTGQVDCKIGDLVLVVLRLINLLFFLASFVAMIFIVWAAWSMITAGGNEEKITKAKTVFSEAIVGFFLVMVAFVLVDAFSVILSGFTLKQLLDFLPKP